jgi:diguanylate cyclase (GGDEF)-like protein
MSSETLPAQGLGLSVTMGRCALALTALFAALTQIDLGPTFEDISNQLVYNLALLFAIAALFCLPREHPHRKTWVLLALGELLPLIGELVITGYYGGYEELPFPSFADGLFMMFYPATLAALLLLCFHYSHGLRGRTIALDTLVTALTVSAFLIWLAFDGVIASIDGSLSTRILLLLAPACDMLMVILIVIFMVILQRHERQPWMLLLLAALTARMLADTAYYFAIARNTYVPDTIMDVAWPIASSCYAYAALSATRRTTHEANRTWLQLTIPSMLGAASFALLIIDRTNGGVPALSIALAAATVVLVGLRNVSAYRELQHLATARRDLRTDELTRIGNRRLMNELLQDRVTAGTAFGVLILDLNRFKEVNDSLGHATGDELLRQVAERLTASVGEHGSVARLAGDEFAAIAATSDLTDEFLDHLHTELTRPFVVKDELIHIGASMGIACFPANATTATDVLARSDHAMYRAKVNRLPWVRYDGDLDLPERDRLALNEGLRSSVALGLVVPYYQAKFDLVTNELVGYEALARWKHPEHGIIPPSRFLPIAERAGLMVPLTLSIIRSVVQDMRTADDLGGRAVSVAINIDVQALSLPTFCQDAQKILAASKVDPSRIVFEVTEGSIMADKATSIATLNRLRLLGCAISIDDYGTGYSSLAYLRDLPVTELKLDRTFAERINDPVTSAIIRSTVSLANELGLSLVAEGIESGETAHALRDLGCRTGQGFYFHHPTSFATIHERLVRDHAERESTFALTSPL